MGISSGLMRWPMRGGRVVGLDGVHAEQENYRKSGFDLAWQNVRFGGRVAAGVGGGAIDVRPLEAPDETLLGLDALVFPARRRQFWLHCLTAPGHRSFAAWSGEEMVGFGTIRPCRSGWKVGPLVADGEATARGLLDALIRATGEPSPEIFLDLPAANLAAVDLADSLGLVPVFETARMYKGTPPKVEINRIFGVTSYELG